MKTTIENLLALQNLELETPQTQCKKAKALREQIPAQVLNYFERFLVRGKKGLALVRNGVCQGCHIQVPLAVVNALAHGSQLPTCGNCGRYLYMSSEEVTAFQNRNNPAALRVARPVTPGLEHRTIRPDRKSRASAEVS